MSSVQRNHSPVHPRQEMGGGATVTELTPRLARYGCEACGAHTNALWNARTVGSCPTCGSFSLLPIKGADPMTGPRMIA